MIIPSTATPNEGRLLINAAMHNAVYIGAYNPVPDIQSDVAIVANNAAFAAVLNDFAAAGSGTLILDANRDYYINTRLELPSNTTIIGFNSRIIQADHTDTYLVVNRGFDSETFTENITIDGMIFDGNMANQTFPLVNSMMVFRNTTTIRLLNCTFQNNGSNGLSFGLSGLLNSDVILQNCTFRNNIGGNSNLLVNAQSSDGVYLKGTNIRVLGCLFENNNDTPLVFESVTLGLALGNVIRNDTSGQGIMGNGIAIGLNCRDITVAENLIEGVRYYGLYCHLIGGSYNEHITFADNTIRSHMATTTLSAPASNSSTALSVHDAAGLVEISQMPSFIIDDTGTPRIFYPGVITNNTTVACTQAPVAYTANSGKEISCSARTSTIVGIVTQASETITVTDNSAAGLNAKPGDFIYLRDNTDVDGNSVLESTEGIRRWMYVSSVAGNVLTVSQATPNFTAGAGNIVTNYYGIHRTMTGATTTVTEASTSMLVENPGVLQLEGGQTFYIVDNTGISRALVCVGVSGLTLTFTQSNPAYTAAAGSKVRSYGEHMLTTTTTVTEASTSVSVGSTLDMDIAPGKVVHVRDDSGTLRALMVVTVQDDSFSFTQTNSAFVASAGARVRSVYGGNTGRHCIYVDGSSNVQLMHNTCIGSYESGIRALNASYLTIDFNRIIDCSGNGISISGALENGNDAHHIDVYRNYIEDCSNDPIASYRAIAVTNARTLTCDANTLKRNQGGGVYLQTVQGGSVSWNTIDDTVSRTSGSGISLLYGCQDIMVAYNDINNTLRYGITLDRNLASFSMMRITLSHNKIRTPILYGILAQNVAGLILDYNDISNSSEGGIRLLNCTDISLTGDRVVGCQAGGVSITSLAASDMLETDLVIARGLVILNNGLLSVGVYSGFAVTNITTATAILVQLDNVTAIDTQLVKSQAYGVLIDSTVERFEYNDLHVRPNRNGGLSNAALNVPTIAASTGAGTSPTVSVSGTDRAMLVTVTTGTAPATGATIVTITFANPFLPLPKVIHLTPANANAAALSSTSQVYVNSANITTALFLITSGSVALAASTTYTWYVEVKE